MFYDIYIAIISFMELGGNVLWLIAALTFLMWTLIFERAWYFMFEHRRDLSQSSEAWEARPERRSWSAHQIRQGLVSQASDKITGSFPLILTCVALCPLLGLLGTVTGMIIGNSLVAAVLIARRVVEEFRDKRPEIEARLALGQPARLAARPYLATAARMALVPNLEMAKATGIVLLPGALVGLILSGVDPLDAVLVQAVVMYMMLGTVTTTAAMMGYGLVNRLFTDDHRLRRLERPAGV
jgi:hypothetical protein